MKIIATALKYYKCYQATTIVKFVSGDEKFVGFIGENGVGKSAVLEGLNSFFTNQDWERNKTGKKGPSQCGIAPIVRTTNNFLIKSRFSKIEVKKLSGYSDILKKSTDNINISADSLLLSCFLMENGDVRMFDGVNSYDDNVLSKKVKELFLNHFTYIYIKAEADIDNIMDVRSKTFALIKGASIVTDIERDLKTVKIERGDKELSIATLINEQVESYLQNEVVSNLKRLDNAYDYKNLKRGALSKMSEKLISQLAVTNLFNNRELTRKIGGKDIGLSSMSSGQRRKAFLDFIFVMLGNLNEEIRERIIFAVDEPEISVDAGSRIQQFEKLNSLTKGGVNVLFTTHWYGWIIQTIDGSSVLIKEVDGTRKVFQSNISNFSEIDFLGIKPYEMRMTFDLLSSLGSWAESEQQQKFLVCEGKTDFNYIHKHFPDWKILSMRGGNIIRLYKVFSDYYLQDSSRISNLIFLIDTDPDKAVMLNKLDLKSKTLKRISRNTSGNSEVVLVDDGGKNIVEKCEIEDLLSPDAFLNALKDNIDMLEKEDAEFIDGLSVKYNDQTGIRAFGIDDVQKQKFLKLYSSNKGKFKLEVSESYNPNGEERKKFEDILNPFD